MLGDSAGGGLGSRWFGDGVTGAGDFGGVDAFVGGEVVIKGGALGGGGAQP